MSKLCSNQTGPVQSIFQSDQGRWSSVQYSDIAACRIMSQMGYITVHSIKGTQCHGNLQIMLFSFHVNDTIWSLNWNNSIRLTTKRPCKCPYWEQMHCSYGTAQHNHSSKRFFFSLFFHFCLWIIHQDKFCPLPLSVFLKILTGPQQLTDWLLI